MSEGWRGHHIEIFHPSQFISPWLTRVTMGKPYCVAFHTLLGEGVLPNTIMVTLRGVGV